MKLIIFGRAYSELFHQIAVEMLRNIALFKWQQITLFCTTMPCFSSRDCFREAVFIGSQRKGNLCEQSLLFAIYLQKNFFSLLSVCTSKSQHEIDPFNALFGFLFFSDYVTNPWFWYVNQFLIDQINPLFFKYHVPLWIKSKMGFKYCFILTLINNYYLQTHPNQCYFSIIEILLFWISFYLFTMFKI